MLFFIKKRKEEERMKKIITTLVIVLISITLVACGNTEKEFNFEQGYITVGMEADYPPFNWMETSPTEYNYPLEGSTGSYVAGYDVEIAKEIAKQLGLELKIKAIPWGSLGSALKTGEIDLIIAGMSPTAERQKTISFTDVYYMSNHVVVVSKEGAYADINNLSQLKGAKGVGQIGTIYAELVDYVKTNHGSVSLPVRDTVPLISQDITSGNADFTVVEKPVALGMVEANNKLKIVLDTTENIFNVNDEDRELAIGHRKVDTELQQRINGILATITQETRNLWMEEAVSRAAN